MAANPSSTKFACPSCRKQLSAPLDAVGSQVACPACSTPILVPAARAKEASALPKLAAVAVVVVLGVGAFSALRGGDGASGTVKASSYADGAASARAESSEAPNLADQIYGKQIKRSGSSDWEVAFAYYAKALGATQIMFSAQERKGKLAILPGRLVVDQVGDGFIMASHTASREQWVLHPDNPRALDDIALTEETSIAQLVGVYAGPEQMETVDGAPRRIPAMIVFGMLTNKGYLDFEAPGAARASTEELKPYVDAQASREAQEKAKEKAEEAAREAERQAQRAKDIAELEQDPSWNPKAKPAEKKPEKAAEPSEDPEETPKPASAANSDLPKARADLAAVKSKIESERKRHADALNIINTLTLNKTKPVKEGSPAYHRCMEASRIISEVEKGAPDLKAEKARLETLVGELDPNIQE
jgi:DNA-directed RNA polymerase subunit RPC12/RpoP